MMHTAILVVGGIPEIVARLEEAVGRDLLGNRIERVASANAALARLISTPPTLILVAGDPGDMSAAAFCERLKQDPQTAGIPLLAAVDASAAEAVSAAGTEGVAVGPPDSPQALVQLRALLRFKRRFDDQMRRERALETVLRQRTSDLWAMEERFRVLVENSPDAVFVEAEDGTILDVNPSACQLHGMKRTELIGRNVVDLVPETDREPVRKNFPNWFTGEQKQHEGYSLTRDGRAIPVEMRASVVHLDQRRVLILHVRDITDRRQNEAERDRLEMRYRKLIEQIPAVTYIFDFSQRRTTYISPQIETLLGFPPELWKQDPGLWLRQIHPEDAERVRHTIIDVHDRSRVPFEIEYRSLTVDGTVVWINNHGVYLQDPKTGQWVLQGVMMDLTRRRDAELALQASREQLAQAQKMEAVGRLSGGIAHDFNNMLTAILGYGQLLNGDPLMHAELKGDLNELLRAAERAEGLVKQLLSFSRRTPVEKEPVDVNESVRSMDRLLRRTLGKDIEIVTLLDEVPCVIEADPGRLEQALMNLAVRARDVMPRGGTLTISTGVLLADEDFTQVRPALHPGPHVRIEVSDTGPLMSAEELKNVFEPFFSLGTKGRGSGLGLAVVCSIAETLGGFAEAERLPERGTRFTLYFPHRPDLAMATPEPEPANVTGGAERILVVDDERGVRSLAARMLRSAGYEVTEASNGVEALHLFEHEPDRFDLVLTDIIMPQMSGTELIQRLRGLRGNVRAMCMTGFMHEPFTDDDRTGRPMRILQKPFTRGALLFHVRQTLDGIEPPPEI